MSEYNYALFDIVSRLELCGVKLEENELLEKTFSTFHVSNILLQQQYKQCQFKTYFELLFVLLTVEQANQLLLKNHDLRPAGSKAIPEVNANEKETPANSEAVGEDQDVVLKGVVVDPHITITNPSIEMLMPQIKTKARSLCRNMTMTIPAIAVV